MSPKTKKEMRFSVCLFFGDFLYKEKNMPCGILLCGLNGSGKSTLNHALAKATGYAEFDAEDYYFPDQKDSRIAAIQTENVPYVTGKDKLPFSVPLSKAEVQRALLRDIENNPAFILCLWKGR